jgi:hypothetical protein
MRWSRGDEQALRILESQISGKKGFTFKDPRELALKAMQELRGQLELQLDIFKTLYDIEAVAEFQKEVLAAIAEVTPDIRDQIISRLKERKAIRRSLELH